MRCMSRIHTVVGLVLTVTISHYFSAEVASIHEAASLGDARLVGNIVLADRMNIFMRRLVVVMGF